MPAPGYYKTNYRALRLRELIDRHGFTRGLKNYFSTRSLKPSGASWLPSLWTESECPRDQLSTDFWLATKPHRKDLEQLGFTECRLAKSKTLNPMVRDTGVIFYLDATRSQFGQLFYLRVHQAATGRQINEIVIAFTAVFEKDTFACTNNKKAFDSTIAGEVLRVQSYDVNFIHRQFLQGLQKRRETPRQFADVEALRQWFDARQLNRFEEWTRRRLFIPMTEPEIALARATRQTGAPPIPNVRPRYRFRWRLRLAIVAVILLLELLRRYLGYLP